MDIPVFKKLASADAKAISILEKEAFSLPWTEEQCKKALEQKFYSAWGLWDGNLLIAYVSYYHFETEMEIINLAVRTEKRRQGLGERLLRAVLQGAAKVGIRKATLEAREGNLAAISLYEKNGFQRAGARKHYYSDTGENAIIYVRLLP